MLCRIFHCSLHLIPGSLLSSISTFYLNWDFRDGSKFSQAYRLLLGTGISLLLVTSTQLLILGAMLLLKVYVGGFIFRLGKGPVLFRSLFIWMDLIRVPLITHSITGIMHNTFHNWNSWLSFEFYCITAVCVLGRRLQRSRFVVSLYFSVPRTQHSVLYIVGAQ